MKHFRNKQARPKKNKLLLSVNTVMKALEEGGQALDKIFISSTLSATVIGQIKKAAALATVPVQVVPMAKLDTFNAGNHEGCIALKSRVTYQSLQTVIDWVVGEGRVPLFLMLDGITDVRNIGGIARTAYCTGVDAIIIPDKGVGALQEDAVLTSAGALEKIAICRADSLLKAIDTLHLNGVQVYATQMKGKTSIGDANFEIPCCIILGGEENGIYPALLRGADSTVFIPMRGDFDSFNVSVSAGIILYEAMKQRAQHL
ncbi:MAG: 23S rRNA (guanosine(2251)-2'-O)-methyltransferase RlmB [Bacteroidetes bacterium]|nr:23S rRNA (guanosine(2251)-2'-O)-methyltransferase RlmB [Bacteroidota bacterium]